MGNGKVQPLLPLLQRQSPTQQGTGLLEGLKENQRVWGVAGDAGSRARGDQGGVRDQITFGFHFKYYEKPSLYFRQIWLTLLKDRSDYQVDCEPQGNKGVSRQTNGKATLVAERDDISFD